MTTMTADQLLRMTPNGDRHELRQGELITLVPAGFSHGIVAGDLATLLAQFVRANHLGVVTAAETGFKITTNPDTVLAPDAAFVSRQRLEGVGRTESYFPGAPDLAVEVVSPGESARAMANKVQSWLQAGALMVWVVRPRQRTIEVHRPSGPSTLLHQDQQLTGEDVVPGFSCEVSALFQ